MSFAAIGITSAVLSTGLGAYSAISADTKQKRAQRNLEDLAKNSPLYKPDKSINDYYQQALNRFNENPYQSQQYQMGAMNARRATAQGLRALQDRRSAIGGISRLEAGQNYAMQNLGAQAEAQRNARFGQLGGATQMKTGEDYRKFDINQMTPYNRMLQLKQLKAQAANDRYNAGLQMIGGAASNAAMGALYGGFDKTPKVGAGGNIAANDKILADFNATRPTINPNYIPNARGLMKGNSYLPMTNYSNWG
jgi:hypothetical protein